MKTRPIGSVLLALVLLVLVNGLALAGTGSANTEATPIPNATQSQVWSTTGYLDYNVFDTIPEDAVVYGVRVRWTVDHPSWSGMHMVLTHPDGTSVEAPYDAWLNDFTGKLAKGKWSVRFYVDSMDAMDGPLYARTRVTVFYEY